MIRIISNTTYGFNNGKFIEPKTKESEPFSVNPKREAELVAAGIAEYVDEPIEKISRIEEIEVNIEFTEESLSEKTMNELIEIAKKLGIKQKTGTRKADLINAILEDVLKFDATDSIV